MGIMAFFAAGCTELGDVLLAPDEPVVYVEDRPFPSVFDPYYNEPKIYRQPRYYYESTSKKTKGNKVFKTTKVKDEYGHTVYKNTTSQRKSASGRGEDPCAVQARRKIRHLGFQSGGRRGPLGNLRSCKAGRR